jgi:hypothetical protein
VRQVVTVVSMLRPRLHSPLSRAARSTGLIVLTLAMFSVVRSMAAQDTPLLSGGVGFFTSTTSGQTSYSPTFEPLLVAPIGPRLLIESRAILLESFVPNGGGQPGYDHSHFIGLTYLQGDYTLSPHITIVGGSYLIPFNTYNDRLSPIWIGNYQLGPLIASLGTEGSGTGTGGMVSGSAVSNRKYSISYNAYFSGLVNNQYFQAKRSVGGRTSLYLPDHRLEIGVSYNRLLQGTPENFSGAFVWWEPNNSGFELRSEFARGRHAQGYWIETAYRTQAFGGFDSLIGRIEPVLRMNQSFRRDTVASDGLPLVNTTRVDVGLDYNLPHNTRILTSYSRQASSTGNENIWETGIVYRILTPAWKGK